MKLIIQFFFLIPALCYAQESDSQAKEKKRNFWGSECSEDTVIVRIGNERCVLYKLEEKVCRIKNERIVWTRNLKSEFGITKIENECMSWWSGRKALSKIVLKIWTDNDGITSSIEIKFTTGKVLRK